MLTMLNSFAKLLSHIAMALQWDWLFDKSGALELWTDENR